MCELSDIRSEGNYTEIVKNYGTACCDIDDQGYNQDCLDQNEDDSDTTDWEFERDHYHCIECGEDFGSFDCENDRTDPKFVLDRTCCVKCHIYDLEAEGATVEPTDEPTEKPKQEPKQDDDVTKLLTKADARQVIEELLKG